MTSPPDIDAAELISVRANADGRTLRVRFRDRAGGTSTLALPACWLDAMLTALPCSPSGKEAVALASWSLDRTAGEDLILTLRSPRGQAFSFAVKPWQISGMATIATYGHTERSEKPPVH